MTAREHLILVIEDNPLNCELFEAVLGAAGYTVLTAGDARAGIEMAKSQRPDLVLMDIQLPGMDGLEATRKLRAAPETSGIPIVAVTAHAKKEDEDQALAAGCVLHLPKPVDTRALPGILARVIDESVARHDESDTGTATVSPATTSHSTSAKTS